MLFSIADLTLDQGATQVRRKKTYPREPRPFALAAFDAALDLMARATVQ